MGIVESIAALLEVPVFQIYIVFALMVGLVLGWYILKALLRLTWRLFMAGVAVIVVLGLSVGAFIVISNLLNTLG